MSADAMVVPMGEVRLDGRVDRMDGTWTGTRVAGQVVRGTLGDASPPKIVIPVGSVAPLKLSNEVGMIVPYTGRPPEYIRAPGPTADVYWFETFMERLTRDLRRRQNTAPNTV